MSAMQALLIAVALVLAAVMLVLAVRDSGE